MQLVSFLSVLSLIGTALAGRVLHEKRDRIPQGWDKGDEAAGHELISMRIALKQSNLDLLDSHLMSVSDPESLTYGEHWTPKQIAEHFAPSEHTRNTVLDWLKSIIEEERLENALSQSLGWLHVDVTIAELESLLQTKYHRYSHASSGKWVLATDSYSLPESVSRHIDFITPTLHFDARVFDDKKALEKRSSTHHSTLGAPGSASLPKLGETFDSLQSIFSQLVNCSQFITPDCLRVLYQIPPALFDAQGGNGLGIVEYTPQAYLQGDLDLFFANFSTHQKQRTPTFVSIDGGVLQTTVESFDYNGESDLDLEYGMTLVNPIAVKLYQVGDLVEGASFSTFLDALDGSFCQFDDPSDPNDDPVYPDPTPGGYKGPEQCGGVAAAKSISTSYAANEVDYTPLYEARQCQEYAKLGLLGTSFMFSSGDYGVAGNGGQCIDPATGTLNNGGTGKFNPSFPGTCPYITSVGATQIPPGSNVLSAESACETVIYSGGGFSNRFSLPSYQAAAVESYFKNHNPPYGADRYNNSMMTRGFPDVAANGANYVIAVDGSFSLVYGTSASSPVFASIIAIINNARAAIGKKSLGFLNPWLYKNADSFNDITMGGNQGCGTPGFSAVTGWDPVTGLGTPRTLSLLAKALALP